MGRDRVKLVKFPVENDQTITSSIDGYLMGYCVGLCGRLFSISLSFRSLIGHKRSVSRTSMLASARPRERLVSIVKNSSGLGYPRAGNLESLRVPSTIKSSSPDAGISDPKTKRVARK